MGDVAAVLDHCGAARAAHLRGLCGDSGRHVPRRVRGPLLAAVDGDVPVLRGRQSRAVCDGRASW